MYREFMLYSVVAKKIKLRWLKEGEKCLMLLAEVHVELYQVVTSQKSKLPFHLVNFVSSWRLVTTLATCSSLCTIHFLLSWYLKCVDHLLLKIFHLLSGLHWECRTWIPVQDTQQLLPAYMYLQTELEEIHFKYSFLSTFSHMGAFLLQNVKFYMSVQFW